MRYGDVDVKRVIAFVVVLVLMQLARAASQPGRAAPHATPPPPAAHAPQVDARVDDRMLELGWSCHDAMNAGLESALEHLRTGAVVSSAAIASSDCLTLRGVGASTFPELIRSVSAVITAHERYITALNTLSVHQRERDAEAYGRGAVIANETLGAELSSMRLVLRRAQTTHVQHLLASIEHEPNREVQRQMLRALAALERYLMAVQFDAPRPQVPWSEGERLEIRAASRQLSGEVAILTPMLAGWPSASSEVMGLPRLTDVALVAARTSTCTGAPAECVRDLAFVNDALEETIDGWTF